MSRRETEALSTQQKQPPAEAVNLARMLSQSQPVDLEQRIEQVASVVRGRTEDEISIALHDNDYDPDRAVAALLDEDGGNVTSEWTTTQRKGKRRTVGEGSSEQQSAAAPNQSTDHRPPRRGPRPGMGRGPRPGRGGAQSQGEGGAGSKQSNGDTHNSDDVVVIEHRPRGRHQGAAPRGKPRNRHERGRGARGQGFGRPPREGRSRNGRSEMSAKPSVPPEPATEELWDSDPAPQVDGVSQGGVANQDEVRVPSLGDDSWGRVGVSEGQVLSVVGPSTSWEENHPGDSGGQWNSEMDHVGTESAPLPAQISRPRVQFSGIEEKSDQKTRPRVKRSSKARIPTDAVEMPSDTVDELGIQFGNLGIGFGDTSESLGAALEVQKHAQEPSSAEGVSPIALSPGSQPAKVPSPRPAEEEFPVSLSVSDTPAGFPHSEPRETLTKIDPPPGLSKPTTQQSMQGAMSMESSLPQSRGYPSEAMSQQPLMQTPSPAAATQLAGKLQASLSKSMSPSSSAPIGLHTLPSPSQPKMTTTVTTHSQASTKLGGPSAIQQQQQQHMMYPPVLPPYMVAPPMPYYDNMAAYYHHVSSAEYPSVNRDQPLMSYGDTKVRDVGSPSAATQPAQQQGVGLQQGHPYLNYHYPYMYYVPPGMPPFSQQMGHKPNAGGFPGASGNSYPPTSSAFNSYEEVAVDSYHRPFGAASQVKAGVTGGGESAFKQYDAKGAAFSYSMPPMGGSASAYGYMHSYGHVMPVPPGDGTGLGARQHQSSKHGRGGFPSSSWGQGT